MTDHERIMMKKTICLSIGTAAVFVSVLGFSTGAFAEGATPSSTVSTSASTQSATAVSSSTPNTSVAAPTTSQPQAPVATSATPATASPVDSSQPTAPTFDPYNVTQHWFKAGGTLGDVWPQTLTAITCGGIEQTDTYTITSQKMADDYTALIAGGVLNSPAGDAEFSPDDYTVIQLPACLIPTTIPLPTVGSYCPPNPTDESVYLNRIVSLPVGEHAHWVYAGTAMGTVGYTAVADAGYTLTGETVFTYSNVTQPEKKCLTPKPPVTVPPKSTPTPPGRSTQPAPTTGSSSAPILGRSVKPVSFSTIATNPVTLPSTSNSLAYTGSSDVKPALIIALILCILGIIAVVVVGIRRKELK